MASEALLGISAILFIYTKKTQKCKRCQADYPDGREIPWPQKLNRQSAQ